MKIYPFYLGYRFSAPDFSKGSNGTQAEWKPLPNEIY